MLFKKVVLGAVLSLLSATALSQGIVYHCMKDGKKIISDHPCNAFSAQETKRSNFSDLPPVTTVQGVTPEERDRGRKLTERLNREDEQYRRRMDYEKAKAAEDQRLTEKRCAELWRYKEQIVAQQRRMNNDWWNAEHRRVNDEIYRLNCGS